VEPLEDWPDAMRKANDLVAAVKRLQAKTPVKGADMLIPALRELAAIIGCQLVEPTPAPKVKLEPTVGKVQAPKEAKPGSRKRRKRDKDTSTPRALKPTSCSSTASPPARLVLDEDVVDLRLPHERTLHPEDRSPEAGRSGRLRGLLQP
jgi:hypothetical protein